MNKIKELYLTRKKTSGEKFLHFQIRRTITKIDMEDSKFGEVKSQ